MGEALMFRAGSGGDIGGSWTLVTEIINKSCSYTIPVGIKNNQLHIRLFGGGGGGLCYDITNGDTLYHSCAGGGGAWMNNGWIDVTPGSVVPITIGSGGKGYYTNSWRYSMNNNVTNGGTTSFGSYIAANGGSCAHIYAPGTTKAHNIYGGNGGSGGGVWILSNNTACRGFAGHGYQFGGGGAFGQINNDSSLGTSGTMGGNGGMSYCASPVQFGKGAVTAIISAENGINTISAIDESDAINALGIGYGRAISGNGVGGGGYGANGGTNGGGGGGYGKNGYGGNGGGGGGAYGHGGGIKSPYNATYGGGGGTYGKNYVNGADGICIIQYYQKA